MQTNNKSGMGMTKHGKSGAAPKSPRLRHRMKREAEKQELKVKEPLPYQSVKELFK